MRFLAAVVLTGLAALVSATPVAPAAIKPRQGTPTAAAPCTQISSILNSNPDASALPTPTNLPAQIAYDCVRSMPLNVTSAKALLFELPIYIAWQSTLDTLKNPPTEYVEKIQPAMDILAGLEKISADIDARKITNEYDFGWELYSLIASAHDGHFTYVPDVIGYIFTWGRPVPLVSVSEDGRKLPSIFAYYDVLGVQFKNISYTPSPVVKIDGQDATAFLEELSQQGSLQDRDALYNNLFYNLAQISLDTSGSGTGGFTGGGRARYVYPGATTTLEFANGTKYTMENYARTYLSFQNITNGEQLAERIITYGIEDRTGRISRPEPEISLNSGSVALQAAEPPPGYPVPIVPGPSNLINGFYIDSPGYEDVAVLQVPNFVGSAYVGEAFQATTRDFLAQALADGKMKLIIDLQANGGGTILQGYDMFKQLFPDLDPYGASRFRYNPTIDLIGQAYSALASQYPRDPAITNFTAKQMQMTVYDYHTDMTADGKNFESWAQKVGPVTVNGANYTALQRWNLSDVYIPDQGGINVTGYGPLANVTGPPKFEPENIVLVTDGYCASTCSIFSELMTQQGGVKTIAFGGRSNANPIQAIGGVKGVNVYQYGYIQGSARVAISYAPVGLEEKYENSVLKEYESHTSSLRSYAAAVNSRDGLRQNDTSGIALQFKYEEADCRLYFTPQMTVDAKAVWKAAADAQWKDSSTCIGKEGYYPPVQAGTDEIQGTTMLGMGNTEMHGAQALSRFEALENAFSLETEYQPEVEGFMQP